MQHQRVTRRHALAALGTAAVGAVTLSGCRSAGSPTVEAGDAATLRYRLVAAYPTDLPYVAAGARVRLPYQVVAADGSVLGELPRPVDLRIWRDDRDTGDVAVAQPWADGGTGYVTVETAFDEPVDYEIRGELDGVPLLATVRVVPPELVTTPQLGAAMPGSPTATDDDTLGVDPICTLSPQCPWHAVPLDAALGSGSPVALFIGSAVYCTNDRCGPSLRSFADVAAEFPAVTAIHAEPFRDPKVTSFPEDTVRVEVAKVLGVAWEPATFFVDRTRAVVARADGIVGVDELRQLFSRIA